MWATAISLAVTSVVIMEEYKKEHGLRDHPPCSFSSTNQLLLPSVVHTLLDFFEKDPAH